MKNAFRGACFAWLFAMAKPCPYRIIRACIDCQKVGAAKYHIGAADRNLRVAFGIK